MLICFYDGDALQAQAEEGAPRTSPRRARAPPALPHAYTAVARSRTRLLGISAIDLARFGGAVAAPLAVLVASRKDFLAARAASLAAARTAVEGRVAASRKKLRALGPATPLAAWGDEGGDDEDARGGVPPPRAHALKSRARGGDAGGVRALLSNLAPAYSAPAAAAWAAAREAARGIGGAAPPAHPLAARLDAVLSHAAPELPRAAAPPPVPMLQLQALLSFTGARSGRLLAISEEDEEAEPPAEPAHGPGVAATAPGVLGGAPIARVELRAHGLSDTGARHLESPPLPQRDEAEPVDVHEEAEEEVEEEEEEETASPRRRGAGASELDAMRAQLASLNSLLVRVSVEVASGSRGGTGRGGAGPGAEPPTPRAADPVPAAPTSRFAADALFRPAAPAADARRAQPAPAREPSSLTFMTQPLPPLAAERTAAPPAGPPARAPAAAPLDDLDSPSPFRQPAFAAAAASGWAVALLARAEAAAEHGEDARAHTDAASPGRWQALPLQGPTLGFGSAVPSRLSSPSLGSLSSASSRGGSASQPGSLVGIYTDADDGSDASGLIAAAAALPAVATRHRVAAARGGRAAAPPVARSASGGLPQLLRARSGEGGAYAAADSATTTGPGSTEWGALPLLPMPLPPASPPPVPPPLSPAASAAAEFILEHPGAAAETLVGGRPQNRASLQRLSSSGHAGGVWPSARPSLDGGGIGGRASMRPSADGGAPGRRPSVDGVPRMPLLGAGPAPPSPPAPPVDAAPPRAGRLGDEAAEPQDALPLPWGRRAVPAGPPAVVEAEAAVLLRPLTLRTRLLRGPGAGSPRSCSPRAQSPVHSPRLMSHVY